MLRYIYAHFHDLSLYLPVFRQIYAHFHDLCNHIQAHMHLSGSSYLPVFACIFVCICLYLPISVSLMRWQRARDSIATMAKTGAGDELGWELRQSLAPTRPWCRAPRRSTCAKAALLRRSQPRVRGSVPCQTDQAGPQCILTAMEKC